MNFPAGSSPKEVKEIYYVALATSVETKSLYEKLGFALHKEVGGKFIMKASMQDFAQRYIIGFLHAYNSTTELPYPQRLAATDALIGKYGSSIKLDPEYYAIRCLMHKDAGALSVCLLYTSPSPRDRTRSRMPSSA